MPKGSRRRLERDSEADAVGAGRARRLPGEPGRGRRTRSGRRPAADRQVRRAVRDVRRNRRPSRVLRPVSRPPRSGTVPWATRCGRARSWRRTPTATSASSSPARCATTRRRRMRSGRERYALASREFLGATVDLEETYAWGWQEFLSIEAELQRGRRADRARGRTARRRRRRWTSNPATKPTARTVSSPGCRTCPIAPSRNWAGRTSRSTDRCGVWTAGSRRRAAASAPTTCRPSDDFSRPGSMWFSVEQGRETFSTWRETTVVYHEGVPGHHLQLATQIYQRGQPQRLPTADRRNVRPCRGLGAVRRAAGPRTRLPGRGRRAARACSTPSCSAPRG